jgi:NAD(P)-dependent dehydrogenase (short-subunit alcohol dehydrogenase family)
VRLTDATIVVTGGASGLGKATAVSLIGLGARVLLVDLPGSAGQDSARELGPQARFAVADVSATAEFDRALDQAQQLGDLRGLVHCAGRGGDRVRILDKAGQPGSLESFTEVLRVNLAGTYNVLRLTAARLAGNEPADGDRGAIVLTASVAAFDGQIGQTAYTAAKAGVHGITLVAARDLASRLIRVNTIAPGIFDTPMLGRLEQRVRDSLAATVVHPKRLGQPEDYARLAVELLQNPYLNGETIRLDGGIRMAPR